MVFFVSGLAGKKNSIYFKLVEILSGGERGNVEFTSCLLPEVTVPMSQFSNN